MKAFYQSPLSTFKRQSVPEIIGEISRASNFDDKQTQKTAWEQQIKLLQKYLSAIPDGEIFFEYVIPRIGKRIDNILIHRGIIFLLEFKVGQNKINQQDLDQIEDYALDLKNFHRESHHKIIIPILIATESNSDIVTIPKINLDKVYPPIASNIENLTQLITQIVSAHSDISNINIEQWNNSPYYPTPTIIEAAQALYNGHNVQEISRSDAGAKNLTLTTECISEIIDLCKKTHKKAICFITGVPGAGKTLAGLNIANRRQDYKEEELTTFLSGNGPLVDVLREALARDKHQRLGVKKSDAQREVNSFIQNIHHFRDDAVKNKEAPAEKVIIFDEAQRAWNKDETSKFMNTKRNQANFNQSEPEFLISVMDRHSNWTVIICLIGDGQEINKGEAGLEEWFNALQKFPEWDIYAPNNNDLIKKANISSRVITNKYLHLNVSLRAFRSENLSSWVSAVLNHQINDAMTRYKKLNDYPIFLTRSLDKARKWLLQKARGSERIGIVSSSGARRLKKDGIYVQREFQAIPWFLNDKEDVRSSFFLEEVATEFDIQGLELDWACIAWDLDLRVQKNDWEYRNFRGSSWDQIHQVEQRNFKKNAYRVLLTRARQGMIIYIPLGDELDKTRPPEEYNKIYNYLRSLDIPEI